MRKKILLLCMSMFISVAAISVILANPQDTLLTYSQQDRYHFTLNSSNIGFLPTSSGSGTSTESNSPRTSNGNPILFNYSSGFRSSNRIRLVKNSGYIRNVTPFTGLKAVTIQIASGNASLAYGSSYGSYSNPITISSGVRYELNNTPYFKVIAGTMTTYIDSINVEYLCDGTGELEPVIQHKHHGYHYFANEPTLTTPGNREYYACSECEYVSLTKDDGEYSDAVLTYELPSDHIAYVAPSMLKKPAQFDFPIAINAEVGVGDYEVDKTGVNDASYVIQSALNYVSSLGGGTVYIPTGKYRLNSQIVIPERVTLIGEFNGVDASEYGTVFYCTKTYNSADSVLNNSQVVVSSNAGINGITFYYPNQDVTNVSIYGYTIHAHWNMAATLANLFFINSYNGITVNEVTGYGGELVNIENVYGTFLNNGISGYYQSDVGYWNNINISPSYYKNALSEYRCFNVSKLYSYTRSNLVALTLADLDDFSLNKIHIDNAKIGIHFPSEVNRPEQGFWGILNDVHLTDCLTGVYATKIFEGGAALFTHSELGKVINVSARGVLKMAKCAYTELLGTGTTMIEVGSEDYEDVPSYDNSNNFNIPCKLYYIDNLDDTGSVDVSSAIQSRLNEIEDGGLVVIKNGTYRLDNPITIPDNTMIASFGNSYSRSLANESKNELVKFLSYSSDSCVKLGNFAGINGIRIYNVYKDPDTAYGNLSVGLSDSYVAVKAMGNNCFAINTEASYTFTGFDFSNSVNHYIKYCYGCAYETFIKASGSGKVLCNLSNHNFIGRSSLVLYASVNITALNKYVNFENGEKEEARAKSLNITRSYETFIKLSGGNELALHTFAYGAKTLIESTNTTLLSINSSQDNLKDENYSYIVNGGSVKMVNMLRVFGYSFNLVSGHLEAYGRFDFTNKFEKYYNSSTSSGDDPVSPIYGLQEDVLNYCESTSGMSGGNRNSSRKYQGTYSWKALSYVNPAIQYKFSAKDISSYMNSGYLRFYLYCENLSGIGNEIMVELTSGGACDVDEITMNIANQIKSTGWNEILVKLSDMYDGPGTFNPAAVNYFRFYSVGASFYYYLDYISFFYKPSSGEEIVINKCESLTGTEGPSLSDFRMEGSYSFTSYSLDNAVFAYNFAAKDVSGYMNTGYLSFYLYVPNLEWLGDIVYVELTSSGICDVSEITCNVRPYITEDGWNNIKIPLSTFYKGSDSGTFNPSACNFFRLYILNSECYYNLDDIRLVK